MTVAVCLLTAGTVRKLRGAAAIIGGDEGFRLKERTLTMTVAVRASCDLDSESHLPGIYRCTYF